MSAELGLWGTVVAVATALFRFRRGDLPACQTRIVRSGRGFPWNHQIAIHPRPDGKHEMTALQLPDDSST